MAISDRDIEKIENKFKKTFATKKELHDMEQRINKKFATKSELKRETKKLWNAILHNGDRIDELEEKMEKGFKKVHLEMADLKNLVVKIWENSEKRLPFIDSQMAKHEKRITKVENHLNIEPSVS